MRRRDGRLELVALHHPGYGAICADWTSPEVRRRVQGGRRQLLARAIGLHKDRDLTVLDATAGLGRDAFTLAALGARVTLAERNATIAALLADARGRALADPATAEAAARTGIVCADARKLMGPTAEFDVVYLDPMYPERGKAALARKEMQLLRELTGGDADADALLAAANACRRIVVKRPRAAPPLAGRAPSLALSGTQARFDIYLTAALAP
ncbi:MAG: class I SAM-dependent methyltransferase [Gammaproteobacteria bacterium]